MDFIIDLLSNVIDLLVNFFTAVGSLLSDIALLIIRVGKAVTYIPMLLSWLPGQVSAILVSTFTAVVIYKILGREG